MVVNNIMKKHFQIPEIGGMRGWAAFVVFLFHSLSCAWQSPMYTYMDGPLMVLIFFALSGDALSVSFTRENSHGISPTVPLKRVLRLSGLSTVSLLLTYYAISYGLVRNSEAAIVLKWPSFASLLPSSTSGLSLEYDVFYAGFMGMYLGKPKLNPFLWTMAEEFVGSLLVFVIGSVYSRLRFIPVVLGLAMLFYYYYNRHSALFIFGVFLGHCRTRGIFAFSHRVIPLRILFGLCLLTLPFIRRYNYLSEFLFVCFSLFCIYASKDAVWFFSTRLSYFLGEISFPVYAFSCLGICSFQSDLTIRLSSAGIPFESTSWTLIITSATAIVLIFLSWLVRYIEMRYLRIIDIVFDWFVDPTGKAEAGSSQYQQIPQQEMLDISVVTLKNMKAEEIRPV